MAGQYEGFFKNIRDTVNNSIDTVVKNNFVNLESNIRRVQYLCSLPAIKDYDLTKDLVETENVVAFPVQKDVVKARELKTEGNNAVQKGDWNKALSLYSQSLLYMPQQESEEFAIILANRSAALYFLEQYEDCIADIEQCLRFNYPRHLRYKVLERKARSLHILRRNVQAITAFQETIAAIDDASKLDREKRQKISIDALAMATMLQKAADMSGNPKDPEPKNKTPPRPKLSGKVSSKYPSASTAVQIDYDDAKGRYATAKRDIQAGEVILVESPYSSVLLAEYSHTHCQNCYATCPIPVPCPTCSNVIFCSEKCKDLAIKTYHAYECNILPLIWRSGCSVTCHIALRMIMQNSKQYFLNIESELDTEPKGPYFSNDYRTVYNLVTHEDQRTKDDLLHRTQMTAFLLKLLEITGFFDGEPRTNPVSKEEVKSLGIDDKYKEDVGLFGSLILRNLQVLQFNAHELSELKCNKPKPGKNIIKHKGKSMFLAGGIYPTLALFNHSCDPSIVRYFTGSTTVVRTVKFIKTGEEISENYGPIFTNVPKDQRQAQLKQQYWFDCKCTPCEKNWPRYEEMTEDHMRFRCNSGTQCDNMLPVSPDCQEFMVKCGQCQNYTNILKGLKSLQETDAAFKLGKDAMEAGKYGEAITKFVEVLKLFGETLCPPYRSYYDCVQELRRCMLSMGNYRLV